MRRKIPVRFEGWHTFVTCVAMLVAMQILNLSAAFVLQANEKGMGLQAAGLLAAFLSLAGLVYLSRELVRQWRLLRDR